MRIDTSVPMHVARAYGLKLMRPPVEAKAPAGVEGAAPATPVAKVEAAPKVSQLVAGQVAGPVDFNAAPKPVGAAEVLQLYTRSADRVEAAVAVQIGRQIDLKA
jgi:hypothetical protein